MERAVFLTQLKHLDDLTGSYDRLYFGHEFCDRLLPSPALLKKAKQAANDQGWDFTLVTPYVTNEGLAAVEALLPLLDDRDEAVVNDWGVLDLVAAEYPQLTVVLGRLLTKQKRGPRVLNVMDKVTDSMLTHYQRMNADVPHLKRWLTGPMRVTRYELDYPLQGLERKPDVPASLYSPWMYVSTTRLCLSSNCENRTQSLRAIFPCDQACRRHHFTLTHENMPAVLHLVGNTIFVKRNDLPDNLDELGIDRLVIQPQVPM